MTPNSVRMELLKRLISEYKIDGVVEIDLQSCTPYTIETHFIRREMEKLGIHYIALETDYSQSDSGQLSTRLEAFLEMLYASRTLLLFFHKPPQRELFGCVMNECISGYDINYY